MSRCFVLGAGFSKAVAGLPVMRDLVARFPEIREQARQRGDQRRVAQGERILQNLAAFGSQLLCWSPDETVVESNVAENLEVILSMIDLNRLADIRGLIKKDGKTIDVNRNRVIPSLSNPNLRHDLESYIYLTLIRPQEIKDRLLSDFLGRLRNSDAIVTLNYDMVLEKALYDHGRWKPRDGYGVEFEEFPEISTVHSRKSEIPVYKLHGSLNWARADWFHPIRLMWFYESADTSVGKPEPIFPGYLADEVTDAPLLTTGPVDREWLLPSFIKVFDVPALVQVWHKAAEALRSADEVVFIGYSLPKADSAACVLFGTNGLAEKRLTAVDPNKDIVAHYQRVTGHQGPNHFFSLEEYLSGARFDPPRRAPRKQGP